MMRLRKKTTIAIATVAKLMKEEKPLSVDELYSEIKTTRYFLEHIMVKLKNSSFITSVRGPGGGYKITDSIDRSVGISILDIMHSMDELVEIEDLSDYFPIELATRMKSNISNSLSNMFIRDCEISPFDLSN